MTEVCVVKRLGEYFQEYWLYLSKVDILPVVLATNLFWAYGSSVELGPGCNIFHKEKYSK